jgi:hypothetical protein
MRQSTTKKILIPQSLLGPYMKPTTGALFPYIYCIERKHLHLNKKFCKMLIFRFHHV